GGEAAARGLQAGDVILRAQSGWVDAPRDLEREVEVARAIKQPQLLLDVLRDDSVRTVTVIIE
ncbi:MAG: serine protease, partial [Dongiaceae bacterium]